MMNVTLLAVGKLKEPFWANGCAEYAKRLGAYCRFTAVELPEAYLPARPSQAEIQAAIRREGGAMLEKIPRGSTAVALCIEGEMYSSEQLAALLARCAVKGTSSIAFLIGGSNGLSPEAKASSSVRLSMSRMTFPHQLARVMLCEQLYRAFSINAGGQYHK